MELEIINKLYLELSQVATARTAREEEMKQLLHSACAIAERRGEDVNWDRFIASIRKLGINGITPRAYRVLKSDKVSRAD